MNQRLAVSGDQTIAPPNRDQLHLRRYRALCLGSLSLVALAVSDAPARADLVEHKAKPGEIITKGQNARAVPVGKMSADNRKRALRQKVASSADGNDRKMVVVRILPNSIGAMESRAGIFELCGKVGDDG
ncbi:hypothetical protein, partial [Bradyrhizobium elkanii]|uniref:hypothetical protein n=1 Tax=Bradyrhizobium elkanii TaxID=29448 RepID=UPI001AEC0C95